MHNELLSQIIRDGMKVSTKFHGNSFISCQDISLKTRREEKSKDRQVIRIHPLGTMNFWSNCSWDNSVWTKVVEWRTNRPTSPSLKTASVAKNFIFN